MPTPQIKDTGLANWTGLGGYRLQLGLNQKGWEASREMLASPNLGEDVTKQRHGAFSYRVPLSGNSNQNIQDGLAALQRSAAQEIFIDVGENVGDHATIGRGLIDSGGTTWPAHQLVTFSTTFQPGNHEHVVVNPVGTLANHWKPGAAALAATGNTTSVQMTHAITADEELVFAVMEPDYPGPSAASTLVGKLQSATDAIFTTPVDRITLPSIGAAAGAEMDVLAGAITGSLWWRIAWTVTGSTPTRYPIAAFGYRKSSTYTA